jgi:hypothetical protein
MDMPDLAAPFYTRIAAKTNGRRAIRRFVRKCKVRYNEIEVTARLGASFPTYRHAVDALMTIRPILTGVT